MKRIFETLKKLEFTVKISEEEAEAITRAIIEEIIDENDKKVAELKKDREYDDALKAGMEQYKFSSNAAQRAMFHRVKKAGLKYVEGKIIGLDEYMTMLKVEDATAFADDEEDGGEQPSKFKNAGSNKKYNSNDEIMGIKSAKERQAAIAENYQFFQ